MGASIEAVDSPVGKMQVDAAGSPVGVVRMDASQSYVGIGELLQDFINNANPVAWKAVSAKIDYTFQKLDLALASLVQETAMSGEIRSRLARGQKLFFKPNTVVPRIIEPLTHGLSSMATAATEWSFIAALMRWFHDKMGVRYHQMAVGEAATGMSSMAQLFTNLNPEGKRITTEAVLEGKSGEFYGGWGFYFARKYLAETPGVDKDDDPMSGYAESASGTYIPPGQATDKLMVYDLNRLFDDETKGREVVVPEGVNYGAITLHKAIIGGNPGDASDIADYPGCVLVNVPKFKVHAITLFTNIIKNLGIGLYPMEYARAGGHQWDYSVPHHSVPAMKAGIPHEVWVPEIDAQTSLPKRDAEGNYRVDPCGGINATMIDIIKATSNQGVFMIHIVDGIEAVSMDHTGTPAAIRVPEGLVFAGLDPVATDLLCARYMFSNVPIKTAMETGLADGNGGNFPQAVPLAAVAGGQIVTQSGFDCPLARDDCFRYAEERGLGQRRYYVAGYDAATGSQLVSIEGHLGVVKENVFSDLVTDMLYFDMFKIPWDLQKTTFSYMDAVDQLAGTSLKTDFLTPLDEDRDGTITYNEFGKKGAWTALLHSSGIRWSEMGTEPFGHLKANLYACTMLKCGNPGFNTDGHDIFKEVNTGATIGAALQMSQMETELPDLFVPGLTFGNGRWPSFQMAEISRIGMQLFGAGFPEKPALPSLYSSAVLYADLTQNEGRITGKNPMDPDPAIIDKYVDDVLSGVQQPLDFTFYVPVGLESLSGNPVPNVKATDDPAKIFTVNFADGREVWPEVRA